MHINYELPIADFIKFILICSQENRTGIVLFFSELAEWGKIVVEQGKILSVRFKNFKGLQALYQIQQLKLVQYHFRSEDSGHFVLTRDTDISSEQFFNFFNIKLEPSEIKIISADIKSAVLNSTSSITKHKIKHAKILIADDSPTARKAISKVLTEAGHYVVEARNGFETLGQIENERPDLLLLDLIMPGIDGYTVLKAIGKNIPHIPIIVLTSRDSLLDKLKSMTLICDAYLIKPVEADVLLKTTNKFLLRA
jgi:CheY-like chemotaxis protein